MSDHDGLHRSDTEWAELIERAPGLSAKTKVSYRKQLRATIRECGVEGPHALSTILANPSKYGSMNGVNDSSLRTYLGFVVSAFKRGEEGGFFKRSDPEIVSLQGTWSELLQKASKKYGDRIDSNERSEREEQAHTTVKDWKDAFQISARDDEASPETLLLAFHALVHPPLRGGDLGRVRLGYQSEGNCIYRNPEDSETTILLIRDHKTSKSFGPLKRVLRNEIIPLLRHNVKEHPREWLFATQGGSPYSDSGFSNWKSQVFREIFGRPVSTNSLRHAYISEMDRQHQTIAEAREVAHMMGHGLSTQRQYVRFDRGK